MNQIYACRKGRELPFTGTTRMTASPKAPDSGGRSVFAKFLLGVFVFLAFGASNTYAQTSIYATSGNHTYVVPLGVTQVQIDLTGAGGAGAGAIIGNGLAGGGGGGGSFGRYICNVTPGQVLNITVGAGGVPVCGAAGGAGGSTTIAGGVCNFSQPGGAGGAITAGGTGAAAGAGGTVNNTGGTGGNGETDAPGAIGAGGGGGGAATSIAPGTAGGDGAGNVPGPGGAVGGGPGGAFNQHGFNATTNGGGGGGAGQDNATTGCGGAGFAGMAAITPLVASVPSCAPVQSAGTYGPFCQTDAFVCLVGTPSGGVFTGLGVTADAACPNAPSVTGYRFTPSTAGPGCHTITYSYVDPNPGAPCSFSVTTQILVYPTAPTIANPAAVCTGSNVILPTVTDRTAQGFTTQYRINGGSWSTSPATPTTSGCHTIEARYVNTAACGATIAGQQGPGTCGVSNTANFFVYPTAPTITNPANVCTGSNVVYPTVAAQPGTTVQYSIGGGAFSTAPATPTTPGCYTIVARYVNTATCGGTVAGTQGPGACAVSNTANFVVFPNNPAIAAPTPTCEGTPLTVTPAAPQAGFTQEYSFDNGGTWQTSNVSPTATPGCRTIRTRWVTTAACGTIPANTAGPSPCNQSASVQGCIIQTPIANPTANMAACCNTALNIPLSLSNDPNIPAGGTMVYNITNSNPLAGSAPATVNGNSATGDGTLVFTPACNNGQTTTVTYTPTYTFGGTTCTGPTQNFTITIHPAVDGTINGPNTVICVGQSSDVNIDLSGTPNFTGEFKITVISGVGTPTPVYPIRGSLAGPNVVTVNGPSAVPIDPANLTNTTNSPVTYRVEWENPTTALRDANNCLPVTPLTGFADITVNPRPQIVVSRSPVNSTVCPGTNVTWTVAAAPGNTVPATFNYTITAVPSNAQSIAAGYPISGSGLAYGPVTATMPACPYNGTITFTATPVANAFPSCPGTSQSNSVTVQDVTAPVITSSGGANPAVTLECNNAAGIAAARGFVPTASDGCSGAITPTNTGEIYTPSCGYSTPYVAGQTGTLVTTWTFTDGCGNATTVTQTITIVDTQAPLANNPPGDLNRTVEFCDVTGPNGLNAAQALAPTFNDAGCDPSITVTKTPGVFAVGACPNEGTITNTFTGTDNCGNVSATYTQVITVVDNTAPVFHPNVPTVTTLNIGAGPGCTVPLPDYSTLPNFVGAGQTIANTTTDCATPGGLFPPAGPITYTQTPAPGTPVTGLGGNIMVTVTATDACGNQSSRTFQVNFVDNTPPNAVCRNSSPTVFVTLNAQGNSTLTPTYFNNGSTDNCTIVGALTYSLTSPGFEGAPYPPFTFTCNDVGVNTVTLIVTDASGNSATCTTNVTVRDQTPPSLTCPATQTLARDAGCVAVLPNYVTMLPITATDACGNTPLTYALAGPGTQPNTITQTPIPGTNFGAGIASTVVTIRATDTNGNSSTCTFTVNFVDNTAPVITCPTSVNGNPVGPNAFVVNTGVGNTDCQVVVTYSTPTVTDNCAVFPNPTTITPVRTAGPASGSQFFVGTTTVTHTATDAAGNSSSCSFTVTVNDNTVPTIQCSINRTVNAGAGCVYTHNNDTWNSTAQDNCLLATPPIRYSLNGGATYPFTTLNGVTFPLGTTTVTARATDASGNQATCSFTVTVVDNQTPSITCPGNQASNTNTTGCRAIVSLPAPTTVDNCTTVLEWFVSGATPNSSGLGVLSSFTFNVGTSMVQYRISDASGNSMTCFFNVVVTNAVTGSISGTATVSQNVATTSTITFTGANGAPNYTFTYSLNGGPVQTVSTTGGQSVVTVAQSNAVVGTYTYTILSVTDANGCAGTISGPATATITVVPGAPDLTSSQLFTTTQIAPGGVIDEVIVLRNVGSAPTSGLISFTVTNYSALTGLTVTQIAAGTNVTIGIDTYTMSAGWTFNAATGTFTSNNVIPAGGSNFIGIRITRGTGASAGANGAVTQTTTIAPGTGGGETPSTNNTISNTILKN